MSPDKTFSDWLRVIADSTMVKSDKDKVALLAAADVLRESLPPQHRVLLLHAPYGDALFQHLSNMAEQWDCLRDEIGSMADTAETLSRHVKAWLKEQKAETS